jgi:hypothetical protein
MTIDTSREAVERLARDHMTVGDCHKTYVMGHPHHWKTAQVLTALLAERDAALAEVVRLSTPPDDAEVAALVDRLLDTADIHEADANDGGEYNSVMMEELAKEARDAADALTRQSHALRREREPVEPVAWLVRWKDGGIAYLTDTTGVELRSDQTLAPLYTAPPDALALVAAAYRDAADRCGAHSYSNNYFVSKALHDASTDILAKTPADAQAALAAIERAAYERGRVKGWEEAADFAESFKPIDFGDGEPVEAEPEVLMKCLVAGIRTIAGKLSALLTQEGRP